VETFRIRVTVENSPGTVRNFPGWLHEKSTRSSLDFPLNTEQDGVRSIEESDPVLNAIQKRLALRDYLHSYGCVNTLVKVDRSLVLASRLNRRKGDLPLVDLADALLLNRRSDRSRLHSTEETSADASLREHANLALFELCLKRLCVFNRSERAR